MDYSASEFQELVVQLEKQFAGVLDVKGPAVREMAERVEGGLGKLSSANTGFDYTSTKSLGFFQKGTDVFSAMARVGAVAYGKQILVISTITNLRIKNRLIMITVHRRFEKASDIETLRDFTKKWTAAVVAANQ